MEVVQRRHSVQVNSLQNIPDEYSRTSVVIPEEQPYLTIHDETSRRTRFSSFLSIAQEHPRTTLFMFALVLRGLVILIMYPVGHWMYVGESDYELGMVSKNIVEGRGFSSPFEAGSSPTAWFAPLIPLLWAGIFWLFGTFSPQSLIFVYTLQVVARAIAAVLYFEIASCIIKPIGANQLSSRQRIAAMLCCALVVAWPDHLIVTTRPWYWAFQELGLAAMFLAGIKFHTSRSKSALAWLGVISGLTFLINVTPIAFLFLILILKVWRDRAHPIPAIFRSIAVILIALAITSPWVYRNYKVFHEIIPVRSNFGVELFVGNNERWTIIQGKSSLHPNTSDSEKSIYQTQGEIEYTKASEEKAKSYIANNPLQFLFRTAQRVVFFWTTDLFNVEVFAKDESRDFTLLELATVVVYLLQVGFPAIVGIYALIGRKVYRLPHAGLLLGILVILPLPHYITHVHPTYQSVVRPYLLMLCALGLTVAGRKWEEEKVMVCEMHAFPIRRQSRRLPSFQYALQQTEGAITKAYNRTLDTLLGYDCSSHQTQRLFLVLTILAMFVWLFFTASALNQPVDFLQDYYAVQAWREGASIYGEEVFNLSEKERGFGSVNFHPPFGVLFLIPFGYLPYDVSLLLYNVIGIVIHMGMCWLAIHHFRCKRTLLLPILGLTLMSPIFLYSATQANTAILVAGGLTVSWVLLERGRERSAGALIATCALLKMFPLFLGVYLAVTRRRVALRSFVTMLVVWAALSTLVIGVEDSKRYITEVMGENVEEWGTFRGNLGITGMIRPFLVTHPHNAIHPITHDPSLASLIVGLLGAIVLSIVVKVGFQIGKDEGSHSLLLALYLVAMLLVSPIVWQDSLEVLLMPVFLLVVTAIQAGRRRELGCIALALLLIMTHEAERAGLAALHDTGPPYWYFILITKTQSLGLILLFVLLLNRCRMFRQGINSGSRGMDDAEARDDERCDMAVSVGER